MRLALVVLLGLAASAFAQNLTPKLNVVPGTGFGCNEANFVTGTEVYGATSCDNPAAASLSCSIDQNGEGGCSLGDYAGWEGEELQLL